MMQILFLNKIYKKEKNVAIVNKSETYSVGNVKSLPKYDTFILEETLDSTM